MTYSRTFSLEDIQIRSGANEDGRTVEAYAAVFDVPVPIHDQDGQYEEVIDRSAFNKAINDARPTGNRKSWRCGVFYNHGKTLYGSASERHSEPIGTCLDMRADSRGLLTVTKYHKSADSILESIKEGAINSYSFSGQFMRSDPTGQSRHRPDAQGRLRTVRRLESSLREYGPTPFPAYQEAEIMAVRSKEEIAFHLSEMSVAEREELIEYIVRATSLTENGDEPEAADTSSPEAVPGGPLEHPTRYHAHALYKLRSKELFDQLGIVLPKEENTDEA